VLQNVDTQKSALRQCSDVWCNVAWIAGYSMRSIITPSKHSTTLLVLAASISKTGSGHSVDDLKCVVIDGKEQMAALVLI